MGRGAIAADADPAEWVARIAAARRPWLLRAYRRRLRFEDLEDCYSQATLELVSRARRAPFASDEHLANALELRFKSRIGDRRRAIEGRSSIEAALSRALPVDGSSPGEVDLEDRSAAVERQVFARTEVRRVRELLPDLSRDQQLVLASQAWLDMGATEFCARHGWSVEKYRKVAQRGRGRLRSLVEEYEVGERCRRLEPDLRALAAGVAEGAAAERARAHLANCPTCGRMVGGVGRATRSIGALVPIPAAIGGLAGRLGGLWHAVRRALAFARHPLAEAGASGGAGVAGGSLAGAGALKLAVAAVCVAGAAGSYAVCSHLGVLPGIGGTPVVRHVPRARVVAARTPTRHHHVRRHRRVAVHRAASGGRAVLATRISSRATTTTSTAAATVRAPSPARHRAVRRRLSTISQVEREFGTPPAHGAAAGSSPSAPTSHAAASTATHALSGTAPPSPSPAPVPVPAQTASDAAQARSEFGFEK